MDKSINQVLLNYSKKIANKRFATERLEERIGEICEVIYSRCANHLFGKISGDNHEELRTWFGENVKIHLANRDIDFRLKWHPGRNDFDVDAARNAQVFFKFDPDNPIKIFEGIQVPLRRSSRRPRIYF